MYYHFIFLNTNENKIRLIICTYMYNNGHILEISFSVFIKKYITCDSDSFQGKVYNHPIQCSLRKRHLFQSVLPHTLSDCLTIPDLLSTECIAPQMHKQMLVPLANHPVTLQSHDSSQHASTVDIISLVSVTVSPLLVREGQDCVIMQVLAHTVW